MPANPLTHHEILALVEPFTRHGRHVDLAASNRIERRLAFKAIDHPAEADACKVAGRAPSTDAFEASEIATGAPAPGGIAAGARTGPAGLRETLELENPEPGLFRLTRVLMRPCGLEARLETEGPHPDELLGRVESIAPQRQFRLGAGFLIAHSHRLEASAGTAPRGAPAGSLILTHAVAQVAGLSLRLKAPTVKGSPADLELVAVNGGHIDLPEDLLAVLGWNWAARLSPGRDGWNSSLRLHGREPDRSREAELQLERSAEHLAQTLAEPPRRFHERLVRAR